MSISLNVNLAATLAVVLFGALLTTDALAKSLYKSVDANGKVTYSNHPTATRETTQNISLLKASPKFSVSNKQGSRTSTKS